MMRNRSAVEHGHQPVDRAPAPRRLQDQAGRKGAEERADAEKHVNHVHQRTGVLGLDPGGHDVGDRLDEPRADAEEEVGGNGERKGGRQAEGRSAAQPLCPDRRGKPFSDRCGRPACRRRAVPGRTPARRSPTSVPRPIPGCRTSSSAPAAARPPARCTMPCCIMPAQVSATHSFLVLADKFPSCVSDTVTRDMVQRIITWAVRGRENAAGLCQNNPPMLNCVRISPILSP